MIALLERLVPLWTEPVDGRGDPEAAFGEVYAGHGSGEDPRIASPMPCYPPIATSDTVCACPTH
jgi:hypothetical protein